MLRVFLILLLLSGVAQAAPSPDGTKSSAPSGPALVTAAGTWTWSSAVSGRPGEYYVNLNGAHQGIGTEMLVSNGGKLYVNTASNGWYVWDNGFINSAAPTTTQPPSASVTSVTGAGTVACSPTTGNVTCTGSAVPGPQGVQGVPGPAGPQGIQGVPGLAGPGPINRGDQPVVGSPCKDGDTLYAPDHSTTTTRVLMFVCDYPKLVWIGPFVVLPR